MGVRSVFDFTGGDWTIRIMSDGGLRLWRDGVMVVNSWTDGSKDITYPVSAGQHSVVVEYFEGTGNARLSVDMTPVSP